MGTGGDVFLLDMVEAVKIVDLAKQMIRLSGFKPMDEKRLGDIKHFSLRDFDQVKNCMRSC